MAVGAVHTPICGTFVCGDGTLCGAWSVEPGRSKLVLSGKYVTADWFPDGLLHRPRLYLVGRSVSLQISTEWLPNRPLLVLTGKPYVIQPYLTLGAGRGLLVLTGKAAALGLSSSPSVNRPLLVLVGRTLLRAGQAGLAPSVPELVTLTPVACQPQVLVAATCQDVTLTPSPVEVR
jgi:hypothetical protein